MRNVLLAALVMITSGCATNSRLDGTMIVESDDQDVTRCKFVGIVEAGNDLGGMRPNDPRSKEWARDKAANLHATHVVWIKPDEPYTAYISGRAYACPNQ